jgi:recombination protein RecR
LNPKSLDKLIGAFMMLPGVGHKTAQRYAYSILSSKEDDVLALSEALEEVKKHIRFCDVCGNFTEEDKCVICKTRKSPIICVVKEPKDVAILERVRNINCLYHVLHGCISPLDGIGPDDIKIKQLLTRVHTSEVKEVIMATNPDVEGEATALYIAKILKPLDVKVTRLAQGISMGSDLEYADEVTLSKAIESRREI